MKKRVASEETRRRGGGEEKTLRRGKSPVSGKGGPSRSRTIQRTFAEKAKKEKGGR